MCIFCGGDCGGAGDVLLPVISAGVPLVVLKIRARLTALKERDQQGTASDIGSYINENAEGTDQ